MSYFLAALQAEGLKIRKSKVMWLTAAAFTIAPFMAGFFMFVLKKPELAKNAGLIGAKAQIAGEANWPSYINLHAQMIAVGGIFVFGFVTSWIFGREYADKTVTDLLALPYSRAIIVWAKLIASFITQLILSGYIIALGFFIGWIIGLPQWSAAELMHEMYILIIVTIITILLSTPAAFFASYSGGYLAPLGFVVLTLVLSQIIAAVGFGAYFPWSIPALLSGVAADELGTSSLCIISITSLSGILATLYYWLFADQH
ncbi:MAG TPA: ABC transporter permease [Bacillota bacterium]|nr:ABC transporter permease [Bacillota bacterium]